jgi:hypothetical protein
MGRIIHINNDFSFKKPVVGIDRDRPHVHFKGGGNDAGNVVDEAHAVGSLYANAREKGELLLIRPLGFNDAIAV